MKLEKKFENLLAILAKIDLANNGNIQSEEFKKLKKEIKKNMKKMI